jgi:hypothetical protein
MSTRFVRRVLAPILLAAAGCAGQVADGGGSATPPAALADPGVADLAGTWRGTFGEVGAGTGLVHGDLVSQINPDGTYRTTWVTHLVAGSSRGGRREMTGKIVANGNRVTFMDASGAHLTLMRRGSTLYGVTLDPAGKRATVSIDLRKTPEAP